MFCSFPLLCSPLNEITTCLIFGNSILLHNKGVYGGLINLLASELFFSILAHTVYKM